MEPTQNLGDIVKAFREEYPHPNMYLVGVCLNEQTQDASKQEYALQVIFRGNIPSIYRWITQYQGYPVQYKTVPLDFSAKSTLKNEVLSNFKRHHFIV